MKITEIFEQMTVPPTTIGSQPVKPGQPSVTGAVQQLADPKLQAAQLATQRQQKTQQKKTLGDQIKALQQQLRDLQQQQSNLNRTP